MNVPDSFMEKVASYLSFRPYREVAGLLAELNQIVSKGKNVSTSHTPEQLSEDKK